jgi:AcrR family transcriptional regulator
MPKKPASNRSSKSRDATFWKVLNAALELDFRRGHTKWTMSELSRKSGITRSLIYYHFGRSKMGILEQAVGVIGEEIVGITPERLELWKNGDWLASVRVARAVSEQAPYLANFYLMHRERPTELGASIRKVESGYFKKLETFFPQMGQPALRAIFALFFGLTFAPHVTDEAIQVAISALKALQVSAEPFRLPRS